MITVDVWFYTTGVVFAALLHAIHWRTEDRWYSRISSVVFSIFFWPMTVLIILIGYILQVSERPSLDDIRRGGT